MTIEDEIMNRIQWARRIAHSIEDHATTSGAAAIFAEIKAVATEMQNSDDDDDEFATFTWGLWLDTIMTGHPRGK